MKAKIGRPRSWGTKGPAHDLEDATESELTEEVAHGFRVSLQCDATCKATGRQCGNPARPWATVCAVHGGKNPRVIAKANEIRQAAYLKWRRMSEQERMESGPLFPSPDSERGLRRGRRNPYTVRREREAERTQMIAGAVAYNQVRPSRFRIGEREEDAYIGWPPMMRR